MRTHSALLQTTRRKASRAHSMTCTLPVRQWKKTPWCSSAMTSAQNCWYYLTFLFFKLCFQLIFLVFMDVCLSERSPRDAEKCLRYGKRVGQEMEGFERKREIYMAGSKLPKFSIWSHKIVENGFLCVSFRVFFDQDKAADPDCSYHQATKSYDAPESLTSLEPNGLPASDEERHSMTSGSDSDDVTAAIEFYEHNLVFGRNLTAGDITERDPNRLQTKMPREVVNVLKRSFCWQKKFHDIHSKYHEVQLSIVCELYLYLRLKKCELLAHASFLFLLKTFACIRVLSLIQLVWAWVLIGVTLSLTLCWMSHARTLPREQRNSW